jgi:PQQ-dependent catabolism-associated CXXCW motif protein
VFSKCLIFFILLAASTGQIVYAESKQQEDFDLFGIDGYRLFRYRSPTPKHSDHAQTLSTESLLALLKKPESPALLDVQPLPWNHVFIQKEPRLHIPGSTWIPNVGLGELTPEWELYFRFHLSKITKDNKKHPLVIYCRADCWMSWNALKRASSWGYSNLYWYRNGSDGWLEHDLETTTARPEPFKP